MGFLKLFKGKGPEAYEQKGDHFFKIGQYGAAKIEYEAALKKAGKGSRDTALENRLRNKLLKSKDALAIQHKGHAQELQEAGDYESASDFLNLALELTSDPATTKGIKELLARKGRTTADDFFIAPTESQCQEDSREMDEEEYFTALCGTLTEETQDAYHRYGDAFKAGYVALNTGNYELAAGMLSQALKENPPDNLIAPELATAYLNLERYEEALAILDAFLCNHPTSIRGYRILCETFWARERFNDALKSILSCPEDIINTLPIMQLRAESLNRSGRHNEAYNLYNEIILSYGWNDQTVTLLAATCEALDKKREALNLYSQVIQRCRNNGTLINPLVKEKYADICMDMGDYSKKIMDIYLSLINDNPDAKAEYFRRLGIIYKAAGNDRESQRYLHLAERLETP